MEITREESEDSNVARRPESINCSASENNDENVFSNPRKNRSSNSADLGQISAGTISSTELKKSSELNSRMSREMNEMMNSVIVQIQRAINDAISNQVMPPIQNAFKDG